MAAAYKATACLSSSKVTFKISSLPSSEERTLKQPVKVCTATQSSTEKLILEEKEYRAILGEVFTSNDAFCFPSSSYAEHSW